jgi:hypothetical protein
MNLGLLNKFMLCARPGAHQLARLGKVLAEERVRVDLDQTALAVAAGARV